MAATTSDEVRKRIEEVRDALEVLKTGMPLEERPAEGVRDLRLAVDSVRRSLWAVLTAQHVGDYAGYLGRVRVHRANDACEDLLSDLYAGTVTPDAPGFAVFHATLKELAVACGGRQQ